MKGKYSINTVKHYYNNAHKFVSFMEYSQQEFQIRKISLVNAQCIKPYLGEVISSLSGELAMQVELNKKRVQG